MMTDPNNLPEEETQLEEANSPIDRFFQHQRRALEETGKALESLLPPGFREHSSEAGREFAKGFRILVDAAIDELKKAGEMDPPEEVEVEVEVNSDDDDEPPSSTGENKIKIEVD